MPLLIDASSLHPSTRLALTALDWLEQRIQPDAILDMGCGNAILSLTASQLWGARILACDISPHAVADSLRNIQEYAPESAITVLRSDGFSHPAIAAAAPYGLIIANLLAQWQVQMARSIEKSLHPDGYILLSGVLLWQEEGIIAAFRSINIDIIQKFNENEWQCYVARRTNFT